MSSIHFISCKKASLSTLSLAISFALYISPLAAQEENKVDDDKNNTIEIISVVAQKRVQNELVVPVSMTTLGSEDIQATGANDLNDLSDMAPNFSTTGQEGHQAAIYMRGVGTWSRNIGFDTRVGVYLDGIYLGQSTAINQAMMELQQAEILRGPQGTLFGKNTIAGAVNLISIKPDAEEFSAHVGLEFGNFGSQQLSGRLNVPLSDTTAIQFSFMKNDFDGQYVNLYDDKEVGARKTQAMRFQLSHEFNDQFSLYFSYDDSEFTGSFVNGEALTDTFGSVPLSPDDPAAAPFVINSNITPSNDNENSGANLTLSYTTDSGAIFNSITGYRDSLGYYVSDTDYAPLDFIHIEYTDEYSNISQEFQWISPENKAFEYVAGLYFYSQEGKTDRSAITGPHIAFLNAAFGLTDPVVFKSGDVVYNRGTVDTSSIALYANGNYQLADKTFLDLGLRYTTEEKEVDFDLGRTGFSGAILGIGTGNLTDKYEDNFISHAIGLRQEIDNSNLYIKWSTGFKSGGFNLDFIQQNVLDAGARFDKETVNSIEAGVKGRYFEDKLKFIFAVFKADYDDYQVNQFLATENGSQITIQNAAKVVTQGIELGSVYALGDNVLIEFNYGYLDAYFDKYPGGGFVNGSDASGNRLPYAPKHSISSSIQYETELEAFGNSLFVARLGHSYTSKQYTTAWQLDEVTLRGGDTISFGAIDAHNLFNMRIGLVDSEGSWDVSLWGKNITNEKYLKQSYRDFFNTYTEQYGDQRMYGLEVNYYFN